MVVVEQTRGFVCAGRMLRLKSEVWGVAVTVVLSARHRYFGRVLFEGWYTVEREREQVFSLARFRVDFWVITEWANAMWKVVDSRKYKVCYILYRLRKSLLILQTVVLLLEIKCTLLAVVFMYYFVWYAMANQPTTINQKNLPIHKKHICKSIQKQRSFGWFFYWVGFAVDPSRIRVQNSVAFDIPFFLDRSIPIICRQAFASPCKL